MKGVVLNPALLRRQCGARSPPSAPHVSDGRAQPSAGIGSVLICCHSGFLQSSMWKDWQWKLLQSLLGNGYLWRHRGSFNNVKICLFDQKRREGLAARPILLLCCGSWLQCEGVQWEGTSSAEQADLAFYKRSCVKH